MSVRLCLTALLLGCASLPAAAQDAQSLIAKNLEARGGAAAFAAIKDISFEGRTIFPGDFEVSYKEAHARTAAGTADRVDYGLQGLDIIQAYDGHGGAWKVNPLQGRKDPEKMSADEARQLADEGLIEGPLLAARNDGSRIVYLGRDDFDGTLAYKLKVTQQDGDEFTYWLDPDTYLEIKVKETELGDYERVAGVYFPMSVESWPQGQPNQRQRTIIANGTANRNIGESFFAEPRGPVTSAKADGEAPDASNQPQAPAAKSQSKTKPPVKPSKPKGK